MGNGPDIIGPRDPEEVRGNSGQIFDGAEKIGESTEKNISSLFSFSKLRESLLKKAKLTSDEVCDLVRCTGWYLNQYQNRLPGGDFRDEVVKQTLKKIGLTDFKFTGKAFMTLSANMPVGGEKGLTKSIDKLTGSKDASQKEALRLATQISKLLLFSKGRESLLKKDILTNDEVCNFAMYTGRYLKQYQNGLRGEEDTEKGVVNQALEKLGLTNLKIGGDAFVTLFVNMLDKGVKGLKKCKGKLEELGKNMDDSQKKALSLVKRVLKLIDSSVKKPSKKSPKN